MGETWTIGELAEHAARALRDGAAAPVNGRVRDVPSERLIRWYTTIGLVDPPLTRRGRVARYGRRHLLQLVAIKRMQAAGHSIAEIQTALAGAEDHTLEAVSGLHLPRPETVPEAVRDGACPTGEPAVSARPLTGRTRFWAERPGSRPEGPDAAAGRRPPEPADPTAARPEPAGSPAARHTPAAEHTAPRADVNGRDTEHAGSRAARRAHERDAEHAGSRAARRAPVNGREAGAVAMRGVKLADGVRLVLDEGRALTDEDVHAVLAAAGPLLAVLEERELT
ncbi:MerR family transcriptional regulator [Nonomuraea sp. NPDC052634]|uniref:helix-turn-helix domain-containing protein n=1 Tax=Nonomuraea sp. NPDC052634 TaxID=3155813 RepID=UPI003421FD12